MKKSYSERGEKTSSWEGSETLCRKGILISHEKVDRDAYRDSTAQRMQLRDGRKVKREEDVEQFKIFEI